MSVMRPADMKHAVSLCSLSLVTKDFSSVPEDENEVVAVQGNEEGERKSLIGISTV